VEGRWTLLPAAQPIDDVEELAETVAWQLLLRWGVARPSRPLRAKRRPHSRPAAGYDATSPRPADSFWRAGRPRLVKERDVPSSPAARSSGLMGDAFER